MERQILKSYASVIEENKKLQVCLGCGEAIFTKFRAQGGGTRRKWCSHKCLSRLWHRNNKKRSNAIKRKSAATEKCKKRKSAYQKAHPTWARLTPEYKLWSGAKIRAREKKIEFTIQPSDILIPSICPLLGIPIISGSRRALDSSPSIDRIDNRFGYLPKNIWVISFRANTAKSNLTVEELKRLVTRLEEKTNERQVEAAYEN